MGEAVFSSHNLLDELSEGGGNDFDDADEGLNNNEGLFGNTMQAKALGKYTQGVNGALQIVPDLDYELARYPPDNGGTEVTSRERHVEKVKMSQRRLSGMKFMGDLNNSFKH